MNDGALAARLPGVEVAVPQLLVIGIVDVGEGELPLAVGAHRLHERVGDADADVGVGDLAHLPLGADELHDVGVPDVADQHQGAAAAAALLDQSGDEAVERAPGDRPAGAAVDAAHVGVARAQAGDVDAHAAAAGHDLHHLRQRVDDAVAGVARRRNDVAVVEGELLVRARGGEDAAAGHEAPVGQQPAEALLPVRPLRVRFRGGDAARDARHHLLG